MPASSKPAFGGAGGAEQELGQAGKLIQPEVTPLRLRIRLPAAGGLVEGGMEGVRPEALLGSPEDICVLE